MSFIGKGETDREENAVSGPNRGRWLGQRRPTVWETEKMETQNKQLEDGLGRDPLDVLLADADRMRRRKELHEDIAEYDAMGRDAEKDMWDAMRRMQRWKAYKDEALRKLQALGAEPSL